jgi:hypothetical protein
LNPTRRPGERVRRTAGARAARAGEDLVLLHLERGHYFTLNETGTAIWDRIGDGAALGELRDALVEQFEVDAETAWRDVVELVDELVAEGLVEVEEPGG